MKKARGKAKRAVERVKFKGVLTRADGKEIQYELERVVESPPTSKPQKSLCECDPYWQARQKALHNRKYHP